MPGKLEGSRNHSPGVGRDKAFFMEHRAVESGLENTQDFCNCRQRLKKFKVKKTVQ